MAAIEKHHGINRVVTEMARRTQLAVALGRFILVVARLAADRFPAARRTLVALKKRMSH